MVGRIAARDQQASAQSTRTVDVCNECTGRCGMAAEEAQRLDTSGMRAWCKQDVRLVQAKCALGASKMCAWCKQDVRLVQARCALGASKMRAQERMTSPSFKKTWKEDPIESIPRIRLDPSSFRNIKDPPRQLLNTLVRFTPSFAGLYFPPEEGSRASHLEYIDSLPATSHPEAFGLHANADIAKV
eukprot:1159394-Pelagomonas_calceolata.AAC.2